MALTGQEKERSRIENYAVLDLHVTSHYTEAVHFLVRRRSHEGAK